MQVANIAPQVSGQISDIRVVDNQFVHKGDVLYTIEAFDFEVAQLTGVATVQQRAADLQVKQVESERRQHLSNLATTVEEQQVYAGNAVQAKAALDAAQQQLAQAEVNLKRTKVLSPVNGYVTNLLMRVGDFAHAGTSNISVIDADSFWIDGYFEETKMARVCVGDRAEAKLMGYAQPIIGHVGTVTRGISASNAAAGTQGLPKCRPGLHLGAARAARTGPCCRRQCTAWGAAGFRDDRNGDYTAGNGRSSKLVRSHAHGALRSVQWCAPAPKLPACLHVATRAVRVASRGDGAAGHLPGADQSRPRPGHRSLAAQSLNSD